MNRTVERPDCRKAFFDALEQQACKLLVFHGTGGVGKSALLDALMHEEALENRYATCDLRRYSPGVSPDMLGFLYTLCDSVERSKLSRLLRFDLAQQIFAAKTGQAPRVRERPELGWEVASYLESVLSAASIVPGLGSSVQTVQFAYRAYQKLRPRTPLEKQLLEQFRAMQADDLARELPAVLAVDMESDSERSKGVHVIFLENIDSIADKGESWLRRLVEATPSFLWVAFSRRALGWNAPWIRECAVRPFDEKQCTDFWSIRLPHAPEADRAAMNDFSGGLPFWMDILAREYQSKGSLTQWLKQAGSEGLVQRVVAELGADQRELLRLLCATRCFDPPLFRSLFPGRSFWSYEAWFRDFLFEPASVVGVPSSFCVRKLYADGVRDGCSTELWQEFHQQIFEYYDRLITQLACAGATPQSLLRVPAAFAEFCFHGRQTSDFHYYMSRLVALSRFLICAGQGSALLNEFRDLDSSGLAQTKCGTWGILCCLGQQAQLSLLRSRYHESAVAIERGLNLPDVDNFPVAKLHLMEQRMRLYRDNPPADIQLTLDAGQRFLEGVQSHQLAAAQAARLEMEALSFLGKQYLTLGREEEAKHCLLRATHIAQDHRKAAAFQLYGTLALVQERLGELMATQGDHVAARALYETALESYTLSDYTDPSMDYEAVLNHGLAHKRMAENEFHLGHTEAGLRHITAALERYDTVAVVAPEIVDLYCKIGWASLCAAQALLECVAWESSQADQVRAYLDRAQGAVQRGCDWEQDYAANPSPTQSGSRQLDNLRVNEGCLRGALLERLGHMEQAQAAFAGSVVCAREAVANTPSHPYSHLGLANSCLALADFHIRRGERPSIALEEGLQAADIALSLAPGDRSILALREKLAAPTRGRHEEEL